MAAIALGLQAQAPRDVNALGWYAYIGDHPVARKWDLHLEAQWRRSDVVLGWQQLLIRPAIVYKISGKWSAAAGYVFSRTYPYGSFADPYATPEHRTYGELSVSHPIGRWSLGSRVRVEQRFRGLVQDAESDPARWRYQNRARYELSAERPISESVYLTMSAEPSLRFGVNYTGRAIDQQQSYVAVGRHISDHWRVEIGYSHQYGVPRTGDVFESNHTLQIRVRSSAPLSKAGRDRAE